jgi:hypothetical protein
MVSGTMTAQERLEGSAAPERPRSGRRNWTLGLVLFALTVAGLGYVIGNEVQVNTQFDQSHAALYLTRARLDLTVSDLSSVRRNLESVNGLVRTDAAQLAKDTSRLEGARAALTQAQSDVSQQGATITGLQTCLGGVEQSLNALAVGDLNNAINQLRGVATPCENVSAFSG